jgi:hypothetical protein
VAVASSQGGIGEGVERAHAEVRELPSLLLDPGSVLAR